MATFSIDRLERVLGDFIDELDRRNRKSKNVGGGRSSLHRGIGYGLSQFGRSDYDLLTESGRKKSLQEAYDAIDAEIEARALAEGGNPKDPKYRKGRNKKRKEARESLRNSARDEAYGVLTKGRSHEFAQYGKNIERFGNSLSTVFGKGGTMGKATGFMGKMGGTISKIGGGIAKIGGKLMGKVNIYLAIISEVFEMVGNILEIIAQEKSFATDMKETRNTEKMAMIQLGGELAQARMMAQITKTQAQQSNAISLATEGNGIVTNAEATAHQIAAQSLFDIKGGAYAAAEAAINTATDIYKFKTHEQYGKQIVGIQQQAAEEQLKAAEIIINGRKNEAQVSTSTQIASLALKRGQVLTNNIIGAIPGFNFGYNALGIDGIVHGAQNIATQYLRSNNVDLMFNAQVASQMAALQANLNNSAAQANAQLQQLAVETEKTLSDQNAEAVKQMKMAWLKMSQAVFDSFQQAETAAYKMGRGMDLSGNKLKYYAEGLSHTQVIVGKWGKTLEDIERLQSSYQETTGRNIDLSDADFNKSFAFGMLVGDDVVAQLNDGMEIFNTSAADANDKFYEMYKQVSKMGLNGKKYTKDIVNNLKLAEKYNFKNGVNGLMSMVKWAQNVRFYTDSIGGMIEKVQTGGLEGIIKQSAELQVLGGNFAMGSDPLAMAWESYMDPEAYAKRMNNMIAGQGTFNKKNGNVSFGIAQQQILRQYAESTGQDYKDVINQARQQVKIREINKVINPNQNFDEDQMAMIANKAQYKDGVWSVKTGKDSNKKDIFKDVNQLTADDLQSMTADYSDKPMEENIALMLSTEEKMKGVQQEIKATLEKNAWNDLRDSAVKMIDNIQSEFDLMEPWYTHQLKTNLEDITGQQNSFLEQFKTSISNSESTFNTIGFNIDYIKQNLPEQLKGVSQSVGEYINKAKNAIVSAINGQDVIDELDDKDVKEYLDAVANKKTAWFTAAGTAGTQKSRIMEKMYLDYKKYGPLIDNASGYNKDVKDKAKMIIGHYDPAYNIGYMEASQAQLKELRDLNKKYYNTEIKKLLGLETSPITSSYENRFNPQSKKDPDNWSNKFLSEGTQDGIISNKGDLTKINDGFVYQNGKPIRIDKDDQVLAAKNGGPLDKMINSVQKWEHIFTQNSLTPNVIPRPIPYDSFVHENPYTNQNINSNNNNNIIEIAPVEIKLSGNVQLSTPNGVIEVGQLLLQDPTFVRTISEMISIEVEKKVNGGRVIGTLNRGLNWSTK